MKVPLLKIERRPVQLIGKPKTNFFFGKALRCDCGNLSKRRRARKLIGAPKSYLDYLDRESPRLTKRIHSFFKKEAMRVSRILVRKYGLSKDDAEDIIDNLDMSDWDVLIGVFSDTLSEHARSQAQDSLGELGFNTDEDMTHSADEAAIDWAKQHSAELVGRRVTESGKIVNNPDKTMSISDTTRSESRDLL